MNARAIDIMYELERTNTALQITIEERDAARIAMQEWRTAATMRRAEADELRNTLAQLREQLTDREHDLAHEFKRANDAEAELRERQAEYENFIDAEGARTLKIEKERDALREQVADLRGAITILRAENHMLAQAQYKA